MNRRYDTTRVFLFLTAAFLCACASGPTRQQRINANAQLFSTYPPEVQANIRAGTILTGYNPDMVLMALGKPDRKYTETSQRGVTEVWSYTAEAIKPGGSFSVGFGGGPVGYGVGITQGATDQVVEKTRVIFQNSLVIDVQQLKPR